MFRVKVLAGATLILIAAVWFFAVSPGCKQYMVSAHPGMVRIPGGTNSGTNPLADGESYTNYYPATYSLTASTFYMDATEVTKAQWDDVYSWAVTNGYSFDNAGSGKAANHPVHTVSWYDCVKWCNARSEMDGRTPCYTVSESVYKTGQSSQSCNLIANGYGLCDMAGNVWEWCNDVSGSLGSFGYGYDHYVRGGSWDHSGVQPLRCGCELWGSSDDSYFGIGFRAVCR